MGNGAYIILKVRGDVEAMLTYGEDVRINLAGRWVVLRYRYRFTQSQHISWIQSASPLCYSNRECALPPAFARDWTLTSPYEVRAGADGPITRESRRTKARIEECACDDEGSS